MSRIRRSVSAGRGNVDRNRDRREAAMEELRAVISRIELERLDGRRSIDSEVAELLNTAFLAPPSADADRESEGTRQLRRRSRSCDTSVKEDLDTTAYFEIPDAPHEYDYARYINMCIEPTPTDFSDTVYPCPSTADSDVVSQVSHQVARSSSSQNMFNDIIHRFDERPNETSNITSRDGRRPHQVDENEQSQHANQETSPNNMEVVLSYYNGLRANQAWTRSVTRAEITMEGITYDLQREIIEYFLTHGAVRPKLITLYTTDMTDKDLSIFIQKSFDDDKVTENNSLLRILCKDIVPNLRSLLRAVRAGEALCFGDVQIKKNPVFAKWNDFPKLKTDDVESYMALEDRAGSCNMKILTTLLCSSNRNKNRSLEITFFHYTQKSGERTVLLQMDHQSICRKHVCFEETPEETLFQVNAEVLTPTVEMDKPEKRPKDLIETLSGLSNQSAD